MKTDYSNMSMLDIVFENRNKQYGAYVLRRDYNKSLAKAVTLTTLSAFVLITGNFIASKLHASAPEKENIDVIGILTDVVLPKEIEMPKEVQANTTQAKRTIKNPEMNVVADNEQHTDSVPTRDDLLKYESGLTTNLDVDPNTLGVDAGTGTDPGLEPVENTFVVQKDPITIAEEMPEFPGGEKKLMEFLRKNTDYPAMEQDLGIQGRAIVRFVVNEDGTVSSPDLLRADSPGFGKEAMRVVKRLPNFKPGKQQGRAVKVYFTLPFQWKQQ